MVSSRPPSAESPGNGNPMNRNSNDRVRLRLLQTVFFLLVGIFLFMVFRHISFPLLWNDEGMTVMHGKRVQEFGYPKVHDGRNIVYDLKHPDPTLGIDKDTDAYIGGSSWGHYYFAAIVLPFSSLGENLYSQTGILRSAFAITAILGILVLLLLLRQFFEEPQDRWLAGIGLVLLTMLSIPLILHIRQVRYYPLMVLLTAAAIFLYHRWRFRNKELNLLTGILLGVVLWLNYMTFAPAYIIFVFAIGLYELLAIVQDLRDGNKLQLPTVAKRAVPLLLSAVIVFPFLLFFNTFELASELAKFNEINVWHYTYWDNVETFFQYFQLSDHLWIAVILKAAIFTLVPRLAASDKTEKFLARYRFSIFLGIFFISYFALIANIPNALFSRYFIHIQPVFTLMLILDLGILLWTVKRLDPVRFARNRWLVAGPLSILFIVQFILIFPFYSGYSYELRNAYEGPIDYVIPYLAQKYENPKDIVIATNYAETVYMHYLDCRVVVGYVKTNLDADMHETPDVLIYREDWDGGGDKKIFDTFRRRAEYEEATFPVQDMTWNTIPELNIPLSLHQFRTLRPTITDGDLTILIKKD